MNNAEFTCFTFSLLSVSAMNISLHRHDEIYRVFNVLLFVCLSVSVVNIILHRHDELYTVDDELMLNVLRCHLTY